MSSGKNTGDAASRATDGERRTPSDRRLVTQMWRFVRPYRALLVGALLLLPLASALQLLPPYLLKLAIDEAIVPGRLAQLPLYVGLLGITIVVTQLTSFGQSMLMQLCGQRAMHDLRVAGHRHLLQLRTAYFDQTPIGRLMTRVTNDVESIAEAFNAGIVALVGDVTLLAGIVGAMIMLHLELALLTFAVIPLLAAVVAFFQRLLRRRYREIRRRLALINTTLQEQINGVKVMQMYAKEPLATQEFERVNRDYRDSYKAAIAYDATLFSAVELLSSLTIAGLLWYGGLHEVGGGVTFGLLVAFVEYVQKFFIPIRDLSAKYAVMQQALASAERVFDLLDLNLPDCPDRSSQARFLPRTPGGPPAVRVEEVDFSYLTNKPVLRGLSFDVAAGASVALVGATGAGKSTIARLLTRLYEIDGGAIYLHGEDIRRISMDALRRQVVVLNQDVFLFAGSVASNIVLDAEADISPEAVTDAAERVGLLGRLSLDHEVTERGSNLSAGERQLVVFARALVRNPRVLLMDEATANIDPESEQLIQRGTSELMQGRTAIIIAHRLTTIERVDRVLVLQHGRVVEQGAHAALLEKGGPYAELYRLQHVASPTS